MSSSALFDRANEEALDLVVAFVANADDGPRGDDRRGGSLDDFGLEEHRLELADAGLHLSLSVLGGVVVAIFRKIAQGPRRFDLLGDLDAPAGLEISELSDEPAVGLGRELGPSHEFEGIALGRPAFEALLNASVGHPEVDGRPCVGKTYASCPVDW